MMRNRTANVIPVASRHQLNQDVSVSPHEVRTIYPSLRLRESNILSCIRPMSLFLERHALSTTSSWQLELLLLKWSK
jgi:hypothetical protein